MNEYNPFYDDLKARKAPVASAKHKKGGSKSHRCTLPSDNLTPAQKKKLNGPVKEYALHEPMSWKDFKAMPADLQQAHLDYIQRRFRIGSDTISVMVFGLSHQGLKNHMAAHSLELMSYKGKRCDEATLQELRAWVNGGEAVAPYPLSRPEGDLHEEAVAPPSQTKRRSPKPLFW